MLRIFLVGEAVIHQFCGPFLYVWRFSDDFLMIFWRFSDDFLTIFWRSRTAKQTVDVYVIHASTGDVLTYLTTYGETNCRRDVKRWLTYVYVIHASTEDVLTYRRIWQRTAKLTIDVFDDVRRN